MNTKQNIINRERILKNIRNSLLNKKENPFQNIEDTPLYNNRDEEMAENIFAEELLKVNGVLRYCENEADFIGQLLDVIEEKEKWNFSNVFCAEEEITSLLDKYETPYTKDFDKFENAEAGITSCDALIARNGSIMLTCGSESGRRMSIYPNAHLVVAYTSQVVMDLREAFIVLREKYDKLPSMISVVTGPSRTADIEKTLVLGAHGPKELIVFLIEDLQDVQGVI